MRGRGFDGRALAFALLATLLIRLLAWGSEGSATALAGGLNQTIPTLTPVEKPVVPPTPLPADDTGTPSAPGPTRPPAEPLASPEPASSSPAPPEPARGAQPTAAAPGNGTPEPTGGAPTEAASRSGGATSTPSEAPPTPSPTATPSPVPSKTSAPAPSTPTPTWTPTPAAAAASGMEATLFSPSCLWPVGGLVLVGAGAILLMKRRRIA